MRRNGWYLLVWSAFVFVLSQVVLLHAADSGTCNNCEHGICNNSVCVCDPCWTGPECDKSANQEPRFTQRFYQFNTAHPWENVTDNVIGQLFATDPDDPNTACGQLWFGMLDDFEVPGMTVDHKTGQIRLSRSQSFEFVSKNATVIVRNMEPFDQSNDTAIVQLISNFQSNENNILFQTNEESNEALRREKRQTSPMPTELKFQMKKRDSTNEEICVGCSSTVVLTITLPSGPNAPTIEIFGPQNGETYEGFVSDPKVINTGKQLSAVNITPRNVANDGNKATHMALAFNEITATEITDGTESDYSFDVEYTTTLKESVAVGTNLTSGAGALLKEVLWIGVMKIKAVDAPSAEVHVTGCPTSALTQGSIQKITFSLLAGFPQGDYWFEIASLSTSLSILDAVYTPGEGFAGTQAQLSKSIFYQVQQTLILNSRMELELKGTENIYATDTTKTDEQRGFKIDVYVQVSPLVNSKAFLDFRALVPNSVVLNDVCEFAVTASQAGSTQSVPPVVSVVLGSASVDTWKTTEATISITFSSSSKESYILEVEMIEPYKADFGSVNVISSGTGLTNFRSGLPLATEYIRSGKNGVLTKAKIHLGVVEITGSGDADSRTLKIRLGIKALGGKVANAGDSGSFKSKLYWSSGSTDAATTSFTIGAETTLTDPKTVSKSPILKITKFQPVAANPMAQSPAILEVKTTFVDDFIYSPVEFSLSLNPDSVSIQSATFKSVGDCLADTIVAGVPIFVEGAMVKFSLSSIVAKCYQNAQSLDLIIRVVILNNKAEAVTASAQIKANEAIFTADELIQIGAYIAPSPLNTAKAPTLKIAIANMEDDQLYQSQPNVLLASMSIQPGAMQSYSMTVDGSSSTADLQLCNPRLVSFDPSVGVVKPNPVLQSNSLELSLGNLLYDAFPSRPSEAGKNTLNYIIPVIGKGTGQTTSTLTIVLTHGTAKVQKVQTLVLRDPGISSILDNVYTVTRLDTMDLNYWSQIEVTDAVGPGEIARFATEIRIRERKCSSYQVSITNLNDDNWPIDLGSAFVQTHGSSIWCLQPWMASSGQKDSGTPPIVRTLALDIGEVCSQGVGDSSIRIVFFARPWKESVKTITQTDVVEKTLTVTVRKNNNAVADYENVVTFNVDPSKKPVQQTTIYSKELAANFDNVGTIQAQPGVDTELTLNVKVPAGSLLPDSSIRFECEKQLDETEARCTFSKIVIATGFNLAELGNEPFAPNLSTTFNTGQFNVAKLSLGTVVHTAATQTAGAMISGADIISATVTFKLADDKKADVGNKVPIQAVVKMGTYSDTATTDITVNRDGTEKVIIDFTSKVLPNKNSPTTFLPESVDFSEIFA